MELPGWEYLTMEKNHQKMSVEKIENGMILVRKGFSKLRAKNTEQMDALEGFNTAMYKLEQRVSDINEVF